MSRLIPVLVAGMLLTGASNSLFSKYQDMQCVANCDTPQRRNFEQPLLQTLTMFAGETLCLFVYLLLKSRLNPYRSLSSRKQTLVANAKRSANSHSSDVSLRAGDEYDSAGPVEIAPLVHIAGWRRACLFWLPSFCDILGTTCMNIGLIFVPVSVYQMLRGALVLWVGLFSVIFLKRKLAVAQITALLVVVLGVAIVGLSSLTGPEKKNPEGLVEGEEAPVAILFGILLVLGAQIFTAAQFVIEEKIMERHAVEPLAAVGYEGMFGSLTTLIIIPVMHFWLGRRPENHGGYFDAITGIHQILDNSIILYTSFAIAVSIAIFNFCGLGVTRSLSATARSTIDTCRTVAIWAVSLYLGWEHFRWLQVGGFLLLVYGTLIFNGLLEFPAWTKLHEIETNLLISEEVDDSDDDDESIRALVNRRAGGGRESAPLLQSSSA